MIMPARSVRRVNLTTATGAPAAPASTPVREDAGVECLHCGTRYDPLASRWLCPGCKQKTVTCCEGAPLPECGTAPPRD
jgi:Zn finger protein HypA/HybF involved in hydrogenase expression